MNEELIQLIEEDQKDLTELGDGREDRDRLRRKRVKEIILEGGLTEGEDFTRAAVIFQHGETLDDWWTAYELGKKAVELGTPRAKWVGAAAYDRWLLAQGKPVKYATQLVNFCEIYRFPEFDKATTIEELNFWGLPSIEDVLAFRDSVGMPPIKPIKSVSINGLQIDLVSFDKPLVFSDKFGKQLEASGKISGVANNNRPIFTNSYGWEWINNKDGKLDIGWLALPNVPVIGHAIVQDASETITEIVNNYGKPSIWVKTNKLLTLYIKTESKVWSITGYDQQKINLLGHILS